MQIPVSKSIILPLQIFCIWCLLCLEHETVFHVNVYDSYPKYFKTPFSRPCNTGSEVTDIWSMFPRFGYIARIYGYCLSAIPAKQLFHQVLIILHLVKLLRKSLPVTLLAQFP